MYKIETIRVTKWFASIPAWIVSTANGVCITIFEIKSIMKAEIYWYICCHEDLMIPVLTIFIVSFHNSLHDSALHTN